MQVLARQIPVSVVIVRLVRAIHGIVRRRVDYRDKPGGDDNLRVVADGGVSSETEIPAFAGMTHGLEKPPE